MLLTALLILAQTQPVQVWEKLLAPGVTYRMEVDPKGPLLINAVRITPQAEGVLMSGELAKGSVFDPQSATNGRETVSATATRTSSLVAVNADFFPFTGDPLGAMVRAGELLSAPQKGRAAFAWGKDFAQAVYLDFRGSIQFENETSSIQGVNQECGDNMIVLSTSTAGFAMSRGPATHAVLSLEEKITPVGQWKAKVVRMAVDVTSTQLAAGEIALTYTGTQKEKLQFLNVGDEVDVRMACTGVNWQQATEVIGGGPFLVKDGRAFVPYAAEGFTDAFARNRHPRTAIGRTRQGDVWIVTVDGRQPMSAGANLQDMADIFLRLGCDEAINLDGGGSTTLTLNGLTVNRPSEGTERAVANSILVFSGPLEPRPPLNGDPGPVIAGLPNLKVGEKSSYRLVDPTGAEVPHSEVLWSANGAAWIDQAGNLTGSAGGTSQVQAFARGLVATITVTVQKD